MFHMDVRHNISDAAGKMTRLAKDLQDKAVTRSLNKTAQQGKTQAGREIKDHYQISTRVISKYITLKRAGRGSMQAVIRAEGKPLPMLAFNARQNGRGTDVQIKGRRITVPHAFIVTLKSGHKGVFARGGYKGSFERTGEQFGRFAFGKRRETINELFTFSVPQGFSKKVVLEQIIKRVNQQFPKVLAQEINYLLSK